MKIIIWDFLGQAENWLAQEIHWERVEIVYKINMNFDLKYLPTILNNIPHEYVLIFENGQHIKIESLIPQLGINRDKLIFAFKIDSWLTHFDLASYLLKHDRQFFSFIEWQYNRVKSPVFMCNLPSTRGGVYIM